MADSIIGTVLNNRYRVDEFLGRGGMSEVYKVWDTHRNTTLAMKVLHEDLAVDKVFMRRFQREAETLAKLQHPNIIRFYGLERDGRLAFMLLDYIEGDNLKPKIFDAKGPYPLSDIQKILRGVCQALAYAHREGLIHCDIKPGNIMINQHGQVLLADFGISRLTDAATATMIGMGTPAYMAPEQVKGLDPVPQTDIYALGVVLYEMLTGGERPFTGEATTTAGTTSAKVRWEQVNLNPPSPRIYNPEISRDLEDVVMKCLAKKPEERYQTPLELLNALELATGEKPAEVINVPVPGNEPQMDSSPQITPLPEKEMSPDLSLEQSSLIDCPGCESKIPADSNYCKECGAKLVPKVLRVSKRQVLSMDDRKILTLSDDIEMIFLPVPAGEFQMGEGEQKHLQNLGEYWIGMTPVTNIQYSKFVQENSHKSPQDWKDGTYPKQKGDHPIVRISWFDAQAFCEWLADHSGEPIRLPSEAEWEKAARGEDGRIYSWGDKVPNVELCNFDHNVGEPSAVGSYSPQGDSPYGCIDMVGNIWEWTSSLYRPYPYTADDGREDKKTMGSRVMRGGSWGQNEDSVRAAYRSRYDPVRNFNSGFRCALSGEIS